MSPAVRRRWLWGVFLVSGAPGLMAQIAWTRIFTAGLGHEMPALMGVVSAFFAGLALGATWVGRRGAGWRQPLSVYGALEIGCAAWILGTTPFLTAILEMGQGWLGVDPSVWREAMVGFGVPLLVIGPAAAALGATLPTMERAVAPLEEDGRAVSGLYAWNTAGAVVGITLAIGWLMPWIGFRTTLCVAAGLQAVSGVVALRLAGRSGEREDTRQGRLVAEGREGPGVKNERGWRGVVFGAGLLGIGFELLGVRALAQTTENTIQTFAMVLAMVLTGTAGGAAWNRRRMRRGFEGDAAVMLGGLALACVGSMWVMSWSGPLLEGMRRWMGGWMAEGVLAGMVFLGPSVGMGMVFGRWVQRAGAEEGGVGRAVAWNALGAALAAPVFLGGMLPVLGLKGSLLSVAAGYLLLVSWRPWRGWRVVLPIGVGLLAVGLPSGLRLLDLPAGSTVVRAWDGRMAAVTVIRTADGERVLRVNNHFQQGGTATAAAARRHAHLPLLLHPGPRRVLFLGVGTGITMGAAADHPGLEVEGVELLPEVVAALPSFEPENRMQGGRREGFRVMTADARRYVRASKGEYDVIVADLFHPSEDGAGMLYTREHFEALRDRLAKGGLVCQWLPLHQLDLEGFRDVGTTFREVFPEATLWLLRFNVDVPVVGLMGGREAMGVDPDILAQRMGRSGLAEALKPLALGDPVRLLGCQVADAASLERLVEGGRVATDDLPRVMFGAARAVYQRGESPEARLISLLERAEPGFGEGMTAGVSPGWVTRLESFRGSRDRHLRGLAKELSGRMREALDDYVASAGMSREYTAGYAQAVLVASAFAQEDPVLARDVLERLVEARPEQGLAGALLERMDR